MANWLKSLKKWWNKKRVDIVVRNNGYIMSVDRNEAIRKNWHVIKRLNDMGKKGKSDE